MSHIRSAVVASSFFLALAAGCSSSSPTGGGGSGGAGGGDGAGGSQGTGGSAGAPAGSCPAFPLKNGTYKHVATPVGDAGSSCPASTGDVTYPVPDSGLAAHDCTYTLTAHSSSSCTYMELCNLPDGVTEKGTGTLDLDTGTLSGTVSDNTCMYTFSYTLISM
jgi:hypothetical protein